MAEQLELPSLKTIKGSSFLKTCFNGVNALSGIGIITIPYAVSRGGWLSMALLIAIAMVTCHTALLLQRCLDSNPLIRSYPDVGQHAFGHKGRIIVSTFIYVESYLIATGFLIMEGDNLNKLFPNAGLRVGGHELRGKPFFTVLTALVVMPSMWLRDLSKLSFVSAAGILSTVIITSSVFWVAVEGVGFSGDGVLFELEGVPSALSLFIFSYAAHGVFPTIYSSMKYKTQFSKVMLVSFAFSTLSYAAIAVIGYSMFGQTTLSQITLNLPTDKIGSKVAIYTTLANPILKYALYISPIPNGIENKLRKARHFRLVSLLIRTLLLASSLILALAFPFFGNLAELIGAILIVTSSILLPCACYVKIFEAHKRCGLELVCIVAIVIMAVAVGIMGSYSSIKEMVDRH